MVGEHKRDVHQECPIRVHTQLEPRKLVTITDHGAKKERMTFSLAMAPMLVDPCKALAGLALGGLWHVELQPLEREMVKASLLVNC